MTPKACFSTGCQRTPALNPGAKAPLAVAARGKQVCSCFDVRERQITDALRAFAGEAGERMRRLQAQLKCGTNCGSCVPELKRIVRLTEVAA